jgi:hypothetical protein
LHMPVDKIPLLLVLEASSTQIQNLQELTDNY